MTDDSTSTKKDALEKAEERLAQAERTVDDSTRDVIERDRSISEILSETQRKTTDVDLAVSDYLSAAVASGIAAEMHKSRAYDCETARHALESANTRKVEASEQRDELTNQHKELRESYTSSQEEAHRVKSLLMNQEMDWIGAKADYYSARLQTRIAADHLKTCREALSQADQRLQAAESESADARSRLDDIESNIDKLLEETNRVSRELDSKYNGLMNIMSQHQYSEMTYVSAEQSANHAQQDREWLISEQGELQKQLKTAKLLEENASRTVKQLQEEIQELSRRSVDEFEKEQRVRRKLREAEREVSIASRERNQEYLNRALEANREQLGHRDQEAATRTTWVLAMMVVIAIIASIIAHAAEWNEVAIVLGITIALLGTLLGSFATRIGIAPSWPRWLQRTGQPRKNWRSRLSNLRFTRGTRSK